MKPRRDTARSKTSPTSTHENTMAIIKKLKKLFQFSPGNRSATPNALDILLITAPPWGTHNPPTGLAYLSTFLQANDIKATVFDGNIEFYRRLEPQWHKLWLPEYKNRWGTNTHFDELQGEFSDHIDWMVEKILSFQAPVLGFSVVDPKERMTIEVIRRLLKRDNTKRILLGGPAISTPEQRQIFQRTIGDAIDYFVEGPGEEILLEIMLRYRRDEYSSPSDKPTDSPLVVHKKIRNLDSIPFPTYEEFNFKLYDGGGFFVEWSRGCISSCAYCKGRHLLGPYNMKKAEHIVSELQYLVKQFNFDHFIICDNLLNGNTAELGKLCDQIIEVGLNITWEGQGIPYKKMTLPLLKKMKAAGCLKLQWGLESASDNLLKNVNKGKIFSVVDVETVLHNGHEAGIKNEIFLIVGLPGENDHEFGKTLSFIEKNSQYIDLIKSVNTLHLVHGTDLYEYAKTEYDLLLPEDDSWYYQWQSKDGHNDYSQRVVRANKLLEKAKDLGIHVQEHNLYEGHNAPLG